MSKWRSFGNVTTLRKTFTPQFVSYMNVSLHHTQLLFAPLSQASIVSVLALWKQRGECKGHEVSSQTDSQCGMPCRTNWGEKRWPCRLNTMWVSHSGSNIWADLKFNQLSQDRGRPCFQRCQCPGGLRRHSLWQARPTEARLPYKSWTERLFLLLFAKELKRGPEMQCA